MDEPKDANQETSAPSAVATPEPVQQTQERAQSSSEPAQEKKAPLHTDPRFQEVIAEKNFYKQELERQKQEIQRGKQASEQNQEPDVIDEVAQMYNVSREDAKKFVSTIQKISKKHTDQATRPLSETVLSTRLELNLQKFKAQHPDFDKHAEGMRNAWRSLSEEDRAYISRTSNGGIDYLYSKAKLDSLPELEKSKVDEGRNEAYQTQALKNSISSSPGSTPVTPKKLDKEAIAKMSLEEYAKNKKEYDRLFEEQLGLR